MLSGSVRRVLFAAKRSALSTGGCNVRTHVDLFNPTPEHRALRDMVAAFARTEVNALAKKMDQEAKLDLGLFAQLGSLGLLGVTIPESAGGSGMDATAACIIHHELSKYDPGFCLAYLAHSMLFVNNFFMCANEKQRAKYLPRMLTGKTLGSMGMTEPSAGTDVLGMATTARRDGDRYLLNGQKTYITNSVESDLFLIYAKINGKISSFVVERGFKGFDIGPKIEKLGMRASSMATLTFEDCPVPAENLLGGEGSGITHMMRNLEIERLTIAAMGVGIAERCMELMLDYATIRKSFGQPLVEFGQIQKIIGDSYTEYLATKVLTYQIAQQVAPDVQNRIGSDAAKLMAAPVSKRLADNAMQVAGGLGYCSDYPVERLWRDAKLLEIGGGTLEAHEKNLCKDLARHWTKNKDLP